MKTTSLKNRLKEIAVPGPRYGDLEDDDGPTDKELIKDWKEEVLGTFGTGSNIAKLSFELKGNSLKWTATWKMPGGKKCNIHELADWAEDLRETALEDSNVVQMSSDIMVNYLEGVAVSTGSIKLSEIQESLNSGRDHLRRR